jgi:hypothetical protein
MGPGTLFVKARTNKKKRHQRRKSFVSPDGVVHLGKRMHRVMHGGKAEPTDIYQATCDKTLHLEQITDRLVTCMLCMGVVG